MSKEKKITYKQSSIRIAIDCGIIRSKLCYTSIVNCKISIVEMNENL